MTDRSIRVRLLADVNDYVRGMLTAKRATDDVTSSGTKTTSALERMVQSARDNRAEWETTGRTLLTVGGAITGIGVAALKTGIDYNTMQQTSRAALTTLLGTAEAANAQMDELDDFARNSPFSKQVFIQAQRQMLGFGIEAKKVIPYLDAIQNAVAATGGSNEDISELVRVFSQVQAAGKITAVDLMQMGQRGVDAATLIGTQMGKTGAQIRQDISSGALDAGTALDALAAGMDTRFGGAADNVKGTFLGAVDRVKAAWRDLSSDIAAPFVDPQGGGLAVDWLNDLADAMRQFQGLPEPIKIGALALAGLVGAASLAAGTVLVLTPRVVELYDALGKVGPLGEKAQAGMRSMGEALPTYARNAALLATTLIAINTAGQLLTSSLGDVALGANEAKAAIAALADEGADLDALFGDLTQRQWWQNFGPDFDGTGAEEFRRTLDNIADPNAWGRAQVAFARFVGVLETSATGRYIGRLEQLGDELATLSAEDLPATVRAFTALAEAAGGTDDDARQLLETMPGFRDALVGIADGAGFATDDATLLRIALGELVPAADAAGVAALEQASAAKQAADAQAKWAEMVGSSLAGFVDVQDAYQAVIDANRAWAEATAESTKSADDSWRDYYDGVSVSAGDFIARLEEQVRAQDAWQTNMVTIAARARDGMSGNMALAAQEMIDELLALGPEGAAQVQALADMSDEEFARVVELYSQRGSQAKDNFNAQMALLVSPVVEVTADTYGAQQTIDSFIRQNSGRTLYLNAQGNVVGFRTSPGAMAGFDAGGYTGDLGTRQVAGVVHGREFVVNARATAQNRPWLEAINAGLPGYADGGFVQPRYTVAAAPAMSSTSAPGGPSLSVQVTADAGLAADFAYEVAMQAKTRMTDALAAHGILQLATGR